MSTSESYDNLIPAVTTVLKEAAAALVRDFRQKPAPLTRPEVEAAIHAADQVALDVLQPGLRVVRPQAEWLDDELASGPLPAGEWWVVDPVEGAINYVHGLDHWGLTATLVRDNRPVLTVVYLPLIADTYTATAGGGAWLNGSPLQVSHKHDLSAALVGTGQASPRETTETFALIGKSLVAMMAVSGVARVSVPPTLQLIHVAGGGMDVFWQHSAVGSGLLAGALLIGEAGGVVSDLRGEPWSLHSRDFLATAPALHTAALDVLTPLS
jgi:myo-inositol-1(or 4)-monophosphatase